MYIEHPYFYEGKYYANIDGEGFMIEDFRLGKELPVIEYRKRIWKMPYW